MDFDEFEEYYDEQVKDRAVNMLIELDDRIGTDHPFYKEMEDVISEFDDLIWKIKNDKAIQANW